MSATAHRRAVGATASSDHRRCGLQHLVAWLSIYLSQRSGSSTWYQAFHQLSLPDELIDGNRDAVHSYQLIDGQSSRDAARCISGGPLSESLSSVNLVVAEYRLYLRCDRLTHPSAIRMYLSENEIFGSTAMNVDDGSCGMAVRV